MKDAGRIPMEEPLAYFLTWTTYGTWLPGDERGWFAKPGQFRFPDAKTKEAAESKLSEPPLKLDPEQRRLVEGTLANHCRIRGWRLHVANCRTQHVHVVVTAPGRDPDDVMDQFKAWLHAAAERAGTIASSRAADDSPKLVDSARQ
jgi:hypothetical protein